MKKALHLVENIVQIETFMKTHFHVLIWAAKMDFLKTMSTIVIKVLRLILRGCTMKSTTYLPCVSKKTVNTGIRISLYDVPTIIIYY